MCETNSCCQLASRDVMTTVTIVVDQSPQKLSVLHLF